MPVVNVEDDTEYLAWLRQHGLDDEAHRNVRSAILRRALVDSIDRPSQDSDGFGFQYTGGPSPYPGWVIALVIILAILFFSGAWMRIFTG